MAVANGHDEPSVWTPTRSRARQDPDHPRGRTLARARPSARASRVRVRARPVSHTPITWSGALANTSRENVTLPVGRRRENGATGGHGMSSLITPERIGAIRPLDVLEPVEIGGTAGAGHVLARHADEGAGEVRQPRRRGFVRKDAGVELLRNPRPVRAADAIGEMQTLVI